ncbi:MAG TPA: hypothetical protein VM911_14450, partial [Pyrinomonadaceae bacterium]|nr:hypothetical protein [Pyrinomonadaceae bacterium]
MPTYTHGQSGTTAVPLFGGGVQAKLAVGQENDQYEREADTVAAQVTSETAGEPQAISAAPS